jgi:hypothetical protein
MWVSEGSVARERLSIVLKQGTYCENVTALLVMNDSVSRLKLYQAILQFLNSRDPEGYTKSLLAVTSLTPQADLSWEPSLTNLSGVYNGCRDDFSFVASVENFVAAAFGDLSKMANPMAHELFERLRRACAVNDPSFFICVAKIVRCSVKNKSGKKGVVIVRSNDTSAFESFLDEAPGAISVARVKPWSKRGRGGVVIVRADDIDILMQFLKSVSGRGDVLKGKIIN